MSNIVKFAALAFAASAVVVTVPAVAAAPVKIGFITTLSTPAGYIGEDLRVGF